MNSNKLLYHGSARIIEKPEFRQGNRFNDYGLGYYCTEVIELAKEWACSDRHGGFVNAYSIETEQLSILNLSDPEYGILHWMAILVNNRTFDIGSRIAMNGKNYLTEHFLPDISGYDAIIGYRADDAYFTFARDFLNNTMTLRQLARALYFGKLGEQFVLKSAKAFEILQFIDSTPVDGEVYFALRQKRNQEASNEYFEYERRSQQRADDLYLADIIRNEVKAEDERLQKIILT